MRTHPGADLRTAVWRKSSRSNGGGGDCLEVADNIPGPRLPIRDSKNPTGPVITVPRTAWATFIDSL
ncbi:DUF397 domain-containing protein [Streptomyces sp. NPDC052225]|uniref:DUF397 domain-containing protein n=1 Tax=Streptomyces sp. NPDC052225 TaxID=3154949 RepID=UPI00344867DF